MGSLISDVIFLIIDPQILTFPVTTQVVGFTVQACPPDGRRGSRLTSIQ